MRILMSVLLVCFVTTAHAQSTVWEINKYKIVQQPPDVSRHSTAIAAERQKARDEGRAAHGLTLSETMSLLSSAQVTVIEDYLVQVGKEYQNLGFSAPVIGTKTPDGKAYEIFAWDYDDSDGADARYGSYCDAKTSYIRMDTSRTFDANGILGKMYEDLAHELFHAIQQSYPLFKQDCVETRGFGMGGWISEGSADALGVYMGKKIAGVVVSASAHESRTWTEFGLRSYDDALAIQPASPASYFTSSIWRYIGEYISNGNRYSRTPVPEMHADYRYLSRFFDEPLLKISADGQLDWFQDSLKSSPLGLEFSEFYANFTSGFIHYIPLRKSKGVPDYHNKALGTCTKVTLSNTAPTVTTAQMNFKKVSARCLEVIYGDDTSTGIIIHLEGSAEVIDSIQYIGLQREPAAVVGTGIRTQPVPGALEVQKSVPNRGLDGTAFAEWTFNNVVTKNTDSNGVRTNKRIIFAISSTAEIASDSIENENVVFKVTLPNNRGTFSR